MPVRRRQGEPEVPGAELAAARGHEPRGVRHERVGAGERELGGDQEEDRGLWLRLGGGADAAAVETDAQVQVLHQEVPRQAPLAGAAPVAREAESAERSADPAPRDLPVPAPDAGDELTN